MKNLWICSAISLLCVFGSTPAAAHDCCHHDSHCNDCWDCGHHGRRAGPTGSYFNGSGSNAVTASIRTIDGRITQVDYLPGSTPDNGMVQVRLQSGAQGYLVRLAPAGFLKQGGLPLREGDTITVKGYAVSGTDGDIFVATEVRHGERSLSLRDGRGLPAW